MTSLFSNTTIALLEKGLDASSLRQKIISNNIANVNTPQFKRSTVKFEEELAKVLDKNSINLKGTNQKHIGIRNSVHSIKPEVVLDNSTTMRTDGNNVDIDIEMTNIAMNQIYYEALVQRINGKFGSLRYVISEGRK